MKLVELARKYSFLKSFIAYLFVGTLNTMLGYCVFALLTYFGLHYGIAMLISTIIGTIFNFFTTGRLVFNNSDNRLIIKFILSYVMIYFINVSVAKLLMDYGITAYLAGFFAILICAIIGYLVFSFIVFKPQQQREALL